MAFRVNFAFVAALAWIGVWSGSHLWPASWWLDVDRVVAFDGDDQSPIRMAVDRTIHRRFAADWIVTVRRVEGGSTTVHCVAKGASDYRPDARLPDPLTLGWWAWGGTCEPLPVGKYIITTTWRIHPRLMPEKTVRADSNVFEVSA